MAIKETYRLYTLRAGMYTTLKSNVVIDTRPEQQLARATEQHIRLKHAVQCHKVSLYTNLIGVMGTIYKCHTELTHDKLLG